MITLYLAYYDYVARNISSKSISELTASNDFELETLVHDAACSLVPKATGVDTRVSRPAGAATHVNRQPTWLSQKKEIMDPINDFLFRPEHFLSQTKKYSNNTL